MKKKEERLEKEIAEAMVSVFKLARVSPYNLEPKPETKGATAEGARNKWWIETTTGKLWKG